MAEEKHNRETPHKPAMVLVEKDRKTITKRSGHGSSGHNVTSLSVKSYLKNTKGGLKINLQFSF